MVDVAARTARAARAVHFIERGVNISEIFIRRPIATSLLMAAIALFGIISYRALPVADLPTVDYPTVNVFASLPGGDPATMAATVASPLERQFTTIAGVDETNITMTFDLDRNIDSAVVDVQTAIAAALPLLPSTLTSPPSFRKQNPADQPILMLNLTSNTLEMSAVDDYAENILAPRISMIDGVSQVNVQGAQKYAVRVQLDPNRLLAERIGVNEVDQTLQNWNVNQPTGQLFGSQSTYTINANGLLRSPNGLLRSAEAFRPIVVAYRQGRPIRLDQVRRVMATQPYQGIVHDGERVLGARIVAGQDHEIALLRGRLPHQRTLGPVPVSTAPE